MIYRTLLLATCIGLSGCAVQTYYAPEVINQSGLAMDAPTTNLSRVIDRPYDAVWSSLEQYVQNRYRVIRRDKAQGILTLTVQTGDPEMFINCGMVQVQQGYFNTDTEFLAAVMRQQPVNLTVQMTVKLTRESAQKTRVNANGNYTLNIGYSTNPSTGAIVGGTVFQFDSKGSSNVYAPGSSFSADCQSTGEAESALINAAAGQQ